MMRVVFIFTLLFLTACAGTKYLPVSSVSDIKPLVPYAEGVDIYAGKRSRGEEVPAFQGDQLVQVRSYAKQAIEGKTKKKEVEFAGAQCSLEGSGFEANVITPASLRVPLYGYASSKLVLRCNAENYESVVRTVSPFNKTKTDRYQATSVNNANLGLVGSVVGSLFVSAINAASNEKKHVFNYPLIKVVFE